MCFLPGISTPIILGIVFSLPFLTLALLVARVGADHAHHALAADDAAVLANATNGTTYFHCGFTLLEWSNENIVYHILRLSRKWEKQTRENIQKEVDTSDIFKRYIHDEPKSDRESRHDTGTRLRR